MALDVERKLCEGLSNIDILVSLRTSLFPINSSLYAARSLKKKEAINESEKKNLLCKSDKIGK